jgi:O-antigen/teichoic acid export membrane protein
MPVLTRLYGPEEFGVFAIYMAVVGLVAVAACLRYEMAIVLPDDEDDAASLLGLSLLAVAVVSLLTLVAVGALGDAASRLVEMPALASLLWLVPLAVLLRGTYQALNYQATRRKAVRRIAASRVGQAATAGAGQIAAGAATAPGALGLVGGQLAGTLAAAAILAHSHRREVARALARLRNLRSVLPLASRYKSFPRYDVPASVLNVGAYEVPSLILAAFFAGAVVGEFAVAMRVVALPSAFVSASLAQVFYQRASEAYQSCGHTRDVTVPSLRFLLYLALPSYLVLGLAAPWVFVPIFGDPWAQAGVYVAVLSPLCFFMFMVAPISQLFFVFGKQRASFRFQLAYFLVSAAAFTAAGLSGSPLLGVILFSALGSVRYMAMLVYMCRLDGISPTDIVFGRRPNRP